MAYVEMPYGVEYPKYKRYCFGGSGFPGAVGGISATTSRIAWAGQVEWEDGGTHAVKYVGIRTATVFDNAGAQSYKLTLQDVNLTAGNLYPDGTEDQTTGDLSTIPAQFSWVRHTLTSSRTVAHGDLMAAVIQFVANPNSSQVYIGGLTVAVDGAFYLTSSDSGSTWSVVTGNVPVIVLESDDASPVYGTLKSAVGITNANTHTITSSSNPKEYGNRFRLPWKCKVAGVWFRQSVTSATNDFIITIYNASGTAIKTVNVDASAGYSSATNLLRGWTFDSPVEFLADTDYFVSITANGAGNVTLASWDVDNAAYWRAMSGSDDCNYFTRAGTAITQTTTRRLLLGLDISSIDIPAAGGGLLVHPGMSGGING